MGRDWHPDTSLMARGFRPLSPVAQSTHLPRGGPPRPVGCFPTSPETSHLCPTRGTEGGSRAAVLCWALPGVSGRPSAPPGAAALPTWQQHRESPPAWMCCSPCCPSCLPQQELALTPASASLRSLAIPHTTTLLRRPRFEGGFS